MTVSYGDTALRSPLCVCRDAKHLSVDNTQKRALLLLLLLLILVIALMLAPGESRCRPSPAVVGCYS